MSRMKGELHPSKNRSGEAGEQRTTNSKARTHLLRIAPAPTVPPYADFFVFAGFFLSFKHAASLREQLEDSAQRLRRSKDEHRREVDQLKKDLARVRDENPRRPSVDFGKQPRRQTSADLCRAWTRG